MGVHLVAIHIFVVEFKSKTWTRRRSKDWPGRHDSAGIAYDMVSRHARQQLSKFRGIKDESPIGMKVLRLRRRAEKRCPFDAFGSKMLRYTARSAGDRH